MARGGALFPSELFHDEDFRAVAARAQRLLMWLWVHPDLTGAGIIAIQPGEWASAASDLTEQDVRDDAAALRRAGWVDYDAGQLWVRPFMRLDGALKSPTSYIAAARSIKTVKSRRLREAAYRVFAAEPMPIKPVDGLDGDKASRRAALNAAIERAAVELAQRVTAPSVLSALTPSEGLSDGGSDGGSKDHRMGRVDVDVAVDDGDEHPAPCSQCGSAPATSGSVVWRPDLCRPCADALKHPSMRGAS